MASTGPGPTDLIRDGMLSPSSLASRCDWHGNIITFYDESLDRCNGKADDEVTNTTKLSKISLTRAVCTNSMLGTYVDFAMKG